MDYIEINIRVTPKQPWTDILTQELGDIGCDSFLEDEQGLKGYIQEKDFKKNALEQVVKTYQEQTERLEYSTQKIPSQNWNAVWESDYEPVKIGKELYIRAPFHPTDDSFRLSIEIQPQMSFGTGHHQTTYLLCETLMNLPLKEKKVLDVGTGTGVLGVVASKLGASAIVGTDIEAGAVENAIENCKRNGVSNVTILEGDIDIIPHQEYDIICANINKNVLKRHLNGYEKRLKKKGILLLSGFFTTDIDDIMETASPLGFQQKRVFEKEDWVVLKLIKP